MESWMSDGCGPPERKPLALQKRFADQPEMNFFVADEAANPFVAADRRVQQSRYTNRP
jgi:hypothetical protein